MTKTDIVIALIALVGAYHGYRKGFIVSAFSVLALVVGSLIAILLLGSATIWLSHHLQINTRFLPFIAFIIVFIAIAFLVHFIGHQINQLFVNTTLGSLNGLLGGLFGIFKYLFFTSLILWAFNSYHIFDFKKATRDSWFYPLIEPLAPTMVAWSFEWFPSLKEFTKHRI